MQQIKILENSKKAFNEIENLSKKFKEPYEELESAIMNDIDRLLSQKEQNLDRLHQIESDFVDSCQKLINQVTGIVTNVRYTGNASLQFPEELDLENKLMSMKNGLFEFEDGSSIKLKTSEEFVVVSPDQDYCFECDYTQLSCDRH